MLTTNTMNEREREGDEVLLIKDHDDIWYSGQAQLIYQCLDFDYDGKKNINTKLVHPEGRHRFKTRGVLFIDYIEESERFSKDYYCRLCVLFPGQRMSLHIHKERIEVFKVIAGVVNFLCENTLNGEIESRRINVGEFFYANPGQVHGVSTDDRTGGLYVGVCHKDHIKDVSWLNDADKLNCIMTPSSSNTITATGIPSHVFNTLIPKKVTTKIPLSTLMKEMPSKWTEFRDQCGRFKLNDHLFDTFVQSRSLNYCT